jgi:hypothetical protein
MTSSDIDEAWLCSQDGVLVYDHAQHSVWHEYLESRLQGKPADLEEDVDIERELAITRQELSDADVTAQGVSERAAAAVRYAEVARTYFKDLVVSPGERQAMMLELKAASSLWERVR